jgi:hypothetical protein
MISWRCVPRRSWCDEFPQWTIDDTGVIVMTIVWGVFDGSAAGRQLVEWDMVFGMERVARRQAQHAWLPGALTAGTLLSRFQPILCGLI